MPDLFEQLVADYLTGEGYLTKLNVNYRKADGQQSGSDIDVLAFHPKTSKVIVADCKSWQNGLWADWMLSQGPSQERRRERFKAVFQLDWAKGLTKKVKEELGTTKYTYTVYCTHKGEVDPGEGDPSEKFQLRRTADDHPISVVTLKEMLDKTSERIEKKPNKSLEPTTLGRFIQLFKAAGLSF